MSAYPIDIVRSPRRKRTVQASLRDGRIRVMVPDGLDPAEEKRLVGELAARIARKATAVDINLDGRARDLARRYRLPLPDQVEWSDRQMRRWGSCTSSTGKIRVSSRLASMPGWVLDSVLIHEMAHLEEANHGPRFQALVSRYEFTERAKGYLMAKTEEMS